MVTITFPDRKTEKRALAFLIGRFSGRVLRSGEHLIPEAALEALAAQNILFTEVVKVDVSLPNETGNPWLDKLGWFKDDPTFDDWQAEIAAYRKEIDQQEIQ